MVQFNWGTRRALRFGVPSLSLAGSATSIIIVATKVLSRHTCVYHDKHVSVTTCLSWLKSFVQKYIYICPDKICLSRQTRILLSRQTRKFYLWQLLPMISKKQFLSSVSITRKMRVSESIVHDDFRSKELYSEYLCTTEEKRNTARWISCIVLNFNNRNNKKLQREKENMVKMKHFHDVKWKNL